VFGAGDEAPGSILPIYAAMTTGFENRFGAGYALPQSARCSTTPSGCGSMSSPWPAI
jgi:hypothetical protein